MSGTRAGRSARRPWHGSWGFHGPHWTGCLQNSGKQNKGQGFVGTVFPKSQNRYRDGMSGTTSGTVFSHNPKIPLLIKYFIEKVLKVKMPYMLQCMERSYKNMGKWDFGENSVLDGLPTIPVKFWKWEMGYFLPAGPASSAFGTPACGATISCEII